MSFGGAFDPAPPPSTDARMAQVATQLEAVVAGLSRLSGHGAPLGPPPRTVLSAREVANTVVGLLGAATDPWRAQVRAAATDLGRADKPLDQARRLVALCAIVLEPPAQVPGAELVRLMTVLAAAQRSYAAALGMVA